MTDWRDRVLNEFTQEVGKTITVADPDRLLTEPRLNEALSAKGFELLLYEDPIAFRFVYETKYRSRLDAGQPIDLIIVCHGDEQSSPNYLATFLRGVESFPFPLPTYFLN